MKNQLLEDIDDSKSRIPLAPLRRAQAGSPHPQEARHAQEAPPIAPPEAPTAPAAAPARQRAGVWRARVPAPSSRHAAWSPRPAAGESPAFAPAPEPAPAVPEFATEFGPAFGPAFGPTIAPEIASFSSREPDWTVPLQAEEAPWTDRWGRKILGWTLGLAAFATVTATAAWMYRDTQVESTLAVVADNTQAQAIGAPPAPAGPPAAAAEPVPRADQESSPLPPLRLLPPEPSAAVQASAQDAAQADAAAVDAAVDAPVEATPPAAMAAAAPRAAAAQPVPDAARVRKAAPKRIAQRHVAAATPIKPTTPAAKKRPSAPGATPARERERKRALARAPTLPARAAPAPQPDSESPLAETLRLCRAAGYHATACLKRGCEATRFGLVCRG